MNVNKTIHEAMGLKWREITVEKREFKFSSGTPGVTFTDLVCKCCDGPQSACKNVAPDYAAPVHYCALMAWVSASKAKTYMLYRYFRQKNDKFKPYHWFRMSRQEQITLIAEAIEAGLLK